MNIVTLHTTLVNAMSEYAPAKTWATLTYGVEMTYINRADRRDGPTLDDCPCCALTPLSKEMSQESRKIYHDFQLDTMVHDDTTSGFENLEVFRKHLQDALVASINTMNLEMVDVTLEYEVTESFPFLWCGMRMRFLESITMGTDPLA